MNIKFISLSGAFVLICVFASPAILFAEEADNDKLFKALDANSDEMISEQELTAANKLATDFGKYDINKDGTIDISEFGALMSAKAFIPVEEENEPIGASPMD